MGFYYNNILYYGRILKLETFNKLSEKIGEIDSVNFLKLSDDRYIIYSKKKNVNDGVESPRSIPDLFKKDNIITINSNLDESFFKENLFKSELESILSLLGNAHQPGFYICCIEGSSLDSFESSRVLYNIKVVN